MNAPVFHDLVHPADIFMDDLPRQFELIAETLESLALRGDLRLDDLQRHFFTELAVEGPVNSAHPALAQLFDHPEAAGKSRAGGRPLDGRSEGFGHHRRRISE